MLCMLCSRAQVLAVGGLRGHDGWHAGRLLQRPQWASGGSRAGWGDVRCSGATCTASWKVMLRPLLQPAATAAAAAAAAATAAAAAPISGRQRITRRLHSGPRLVGENRTGGPWIVLAIGEAAAAGAGRWLRGQAAAWRCHHACMVRRSALRGHAWHRRSHCAHTREAAAHA